MDSQYTRRRFLIRSISGVAAVAVMPVAARLPAGPGRLRLGLVGLGGRGSRLLSICRAARLPVTALCDRDSAALRACAFHNPAIPAMQSAQALLGRDDVDAVVLSVPQSLALAEQALASGKHVFLASAPRIAAPAAERLQRLADAGRLQMGLAPSDFGWDAAELDGLIGSCGALCPGAVRLAVTSGSPHTWDVLHSAAGLLAARLPSRADAIRAYTPLGSTEMARFTFAEREWKLEMQIRTAPEMPKGMVVIEARIPLSRGAGRLTIESVSDSVLSAADPAPMPALQRFLAAGGGSGEALTRHSLAVARYASLWNDAVESQPAAQRDDYARSELGNNYVRSK